MFAGGNNTALVAAIIGGGTLILVIVLVIAFFQWRKRATIDDTPRAPVGSSPSVQVPSPTSTLSRWESGSSPSSIVSSWFSFGKPSNSSGNNNINRNIKLEVPREVKTIFDKEKPVVFHYDEIIEATDNFNDSRKLGQSAYGAVFFGILRQQEVAIKQMKATKSREFLAELKVLCKVHHTNLVELIGYSASSESLFLIYEYAERGALSKHLHNTTLNIEDDQLLSWTVRVQIALDAARGLEYIHEYTTTHYIHRDVKTSNILLDGLFRAKVADFGLAKLVEKNADNSQSVSSTRIVGTVGYLAPEYMMSGHATSKCDVYAFGVVLFELITGQEAVTRTNNSACWRSLISYMLNVLKDESEQKQTFKNVVDKRLGDRYPLEHAIKLAKLARACVEEDPANRPHMRQIVFSLSQLLLHSIQWDASLAGSSEILNGLTYDRYILTHLCREIG